MSGAFPRVLHVSEVLPGGVGRYIDRLSQAQARDAGGGRIAVLAPQDELGLLADDPAIARFGYRQDRRGASGLLALARELRRTVAEFDPDVVHLHSSLAGIVGRLYRPGSQRRRPALCYTAHGWAIDPDRTMRGRGLAVAVERWLAGRCDRIVNISPHEDAFLTASGFPAGKLRLVQTGLELGPDPVFPERGDGPIRLLFVGRLDPQKGFDLLWPELAQADPARLALRVAGMAMKGAGATHPALSHVEYLGWVTPDRIADELRWADALVMPSRWEGMPLAALEAMRAGRAVLSSDRGAFRTIVDHGETGLQMDIDRPGFLTRALDGATRADLARMGRAGRARIENDLRQDRMVSEMWAVYREMLAGRAESSSSISADNAAAERSHE